jgi:hypothetical protein
MEEEVARRGHRVVRSAHDFAERVQMGRSRLPEQPVPRIGAKPYDAGQLAFQVTESNRAQEGGEVSAERTDGAGSLDSWIHRENQEDRITR